MSRRPLLATVAAGFLWGAGAGAAPPVSYRVEARWDRGTGLLTGRQTVAVPNAGASPLSEVTLRLPLEAYRDDRARALSGPVPGKRRGDERWYGFLEVSRASAAGGPALKALSAADPTLARFVLPSPLPPGESLALELEFAARVPRGAYGAGVKDDFLLAAGWFPRAVLPGAQGAPADFDVTLDLPADVAGKVAAPGEVRELGRADGRVTVAVRASGLADLAFAVSPGFEVHREVVAEPGVPRTEVVLFLQPDRRRTRLRYLAAARASLVALGRSLGPSPLRTLALVDPPHGSGLQGTAHPGLVVGGERWPALPGDGSLERNVASGVAAQYVGSLFRPGGDGAEELLAALAGSLAGRALPPRAAPAPSSHAAALLLSMERTYGAQAWDRVVSAFSRRHAGTAVTAADFLAAVGEALGPGAGELAARAWERPGGVGYAVSPPESVPALSSAGWEGRGTGRRFVPGVADPVQGEWESAAVVRRTGEIAWPIDVELLFEDGASVRKVWNGGSTWIRYRALGPRLSAVRLDPLERCALLRPRGAASLSSGREPFAPAAFRHRLRFLAQNVVELFALVGTLPAAAP